MSALAHAMSIVLAATPLAATDAPQQLTLLGQFEPWHYPDSEFQGATMSDVETLDAAGNRTMPSVQCKAVLATEDPISKVFAYYQSKLEPPTQSPDAAAAEEQQSGSSRAVTFHSDFEGRPLGLHIIQVNTEFTSTTLVVSRAKSETKTHIAWLQYIQLPINDLPR